MFLLMSIGEGQGWSGRVGEGHLLTAARQLSGGYCVLDGSDISTLSQCLFELTAVRRRQAVAKFKCLLLPRPALGLHLSCLGNV